MVVAQTKTALLEHLDWRVTIAEVPGETGELDRCRGLDLEHGRECGTDLEIAAILECEQVAIGKMMRLGEVEQEGRAAVGGEADAAAVTVVMGQGHSVEGLAFAGDRGRAQWQAFGGHAGSALPSVPRA